MADEFVVPYAAAAEALGAMHGGTAAFVAALALWLVVLFYMLYVVTERHFVVALSSLAAMLRLSPDIAGLTLLAVGNGAPDFFTAVFGAEKQFGMILGSTVGSGLFILTVVFGLVIWVAKPVKHGIIAADHAEAPDRGVTPKLSQRALLRNAAVYLMALCLLVLMIAVRHVPLWLCAVLPTAYVVYMGGTLAEYFVRRRRVQSVLKSDSPQQSVVLRTENIGGGTLAGEVCAIVDWPASDASLLWLRRAWCLLSAALTLPLTLTILPLEYSEATMRINRARCIASPLLAVPFVAFLVLPEALSSDWRAWLCVVGLSVCLSLVLLATTSVQRRPRMFQLHVIAAFMICIAWIYAACSELVAALTTLGETLDVSPVVLGVLVLAWGNSFGDLVANVAVSHGGGFETAVAAVLCGPIQNALLTLGVAFILGALASPHHILVVEIGPTVLLPLVLLVATVVVSVGVIVYVYQCRVPRRMGLALLCVYVLYLPAALILALHSA